MATKMVFVHTQTGREYELVRQRRDGNTLYVTLKGDLAEFEEVFDKELFKKRGYVLQQRTA
jgi:hypothetical protein